MHGPTHLFIVHLPTAVGADEHLRVFNDDTSCPWLIKHVHAQEFMDSFYQKRLATKEARIQEMRKAHALLERQVCVCQGSAALTALISISDLVQR